jgi:hypothetical protein
LGFEALDLGVFYTLCREYLLVGDSLEGEAPDEPKLVSQRRLDGSLALHVMRKY